MQSALLLCLLFSALLNAQSIDPKAKPQPGVKFEMRPGPLVSGPVPVEKDPGDDVIVRPDGAIVATSRSRSFVFPLTNRMEPTLSVSYSFVNNRILYEYSLSNGAIAADPISSFMLGIAVDAEVTAPEPWKSMKVTRPFEPPMLGFYRAVIDSDSARGLLRAGESVRSIRVSCDGVPGLVESTIYPEPLQPQYRANEYQEFMGATSPWVRRRLTELDTADRHRLRGLAIGPVTPLGADSIEAIRKEIQTASQRPQFAALQVQVRSQSFPIDKAGLARWLADARKQAASGIVADFLDAMVWRLNRLP